MDNICDNDILKMSPVFAGLTTVNIHYLKLLHHMNYIILYNTIPS